MGSPASTSMVGGSMDIAARTIDLLAVLAKVGDSTGISTAVVREIGRWLGKEGLDQNELDFFLHQSRALAIPNQADNVVAFFEAVTDDRIQPSPVVPLWVRPSGGLGRYISSDPLQKWITSTTCCLFRYHDEVFVKEFLPTFILIASQPDKPPPSKRQIRRDPAALRLSVVTKKVVESCYLHIANAGLLGQAQQCPQLPEAFSWACKEGHNVDGYNLAVLMSKLSNVHTEIIIQSERLLTNLVLWVLWHYAGRFRVVVSGKVMYDNELGQEGTILECRVAESCSKGHSLYNHEGNKTGMPFQVLENFGGNLRSLFTGQYDTRETLQQRGCSRQELYYIPFQYPKEYQKIEIRARNIARELLKWYINIPVKSPDESFLFNNNLELHFQLDLDSGNHDAPSFEGLRVGHILGRTPRLLNMEAGDLKFKLGSAVFEPFSSPQNFRQSRGGGKYRRHLFNGNMVQKWLELLDRFPILDALCSEAETECACMKCTISESRLKAYEALEEYSPYDPSCFVHYAFTAVMLYFAHGIADAFGAQDASAISGPAEGDFEAYGATDILLDAIGKSRTIKRYYTMSWGTLLRTAAQVLFGRLPFQQLTDMRVLQGPNIVAVQHGALAAIAPWLDISQQLNLRGCFRFEVVQGCIALPRRDNIGQPTFHSVFGDFGVIETEGTEDMSDSGEYRVTSVRVPGEAIKVVRDLSPQHHDWMLFPADRTRLVLLLRVSSGQYSRIVDPSNAIRTLCRAFNITTCKHSALNTASVPEWCLVGLTPFEELLGTWDYSDTEELRKMAATELENVNIAGTSSIKTAKPSNVDSEGEVDTCSSPEGEPTPYPSYADRLIHSSQLLDTHFKFNTALALIGDGTVFLNSGETCLKCSLEFARDLSSADDGRCRWLLHQIDQPTETVPQHKARRQIAYLGSKSSQSQTST